MCLKSPVTIKPQWEMNVHVLFKNSSLTDFIVEFKSFYFAWSLSHLCIYLCVFVCMWWWWFRVFFFRTTLILCFFHFIYIPHDWIKLLSGLGFWIWTELDWAGGLVWFPAVFCCNFTCGFLWFLYCCGIKIKCQNTCQHDILWLRQTFSCCALALTMYFCDPLAFPLAAPCGWHLFLVKYLNNYYIVMKFMILPLVLLNLDLFFPP